MQRRTFIGSSLSLGMAASLPAGARAAGLQAAGPLFDRLIADSLKASPQSAALYELDEGPLKRRLDDRGNGNRLGLLGPLLEARSALAALPQESDPRQRQWTQTARWFAEAARQMSHIPHLTVSSYGYPIPYALSQLSGAYQDVPDLLTGQHSIKTAADCDAYLARLDQLGRAIDQDTAMSVEQAAAGIVPPDFICDRTLTQIGTLAASRGADAGMVRALADKAHAAGIGGDWERRATALVDGPIAAALARQKVHMEALRRRATSAAGMRDRPGGTAFYDVALRFHATTDDTPAQVHRTGLDHVAATRAEIDALLVRLGHRDGSVTDRLSALGKDPAQLFPDDDAGRAALLTYVRERTEDVKRRLPAAFSRVPDAPMDIRRVPVATELGAPSASSLAGAIYFNLSTTAAWPKWQLPTVIYHEGYPGHHFQDSLVKETSGTPPLFRILSPNAYNEGWALYAEQVADELGVYDAAPIGRLGRLQDDLFRSCRLVVDTGIHAMGWSRERAIAYLIEEGGQLPDTARREIERYVVWPGQACSYKIGQLEFLRQRALAKARLGDSFSIKAFHGAVLLGGGMPLAVMADTLGEIAERLICSKSSARCGFG